MMQRRPRVPSAGFGAPRAGLENVSVGETPEADVLTSIEKLPRGQSRVASKVPRMQASMSRSLFVVAGLYRLARSLR